MSHSDSAAAFQHQPHQGWQEEYGEHELLRCVSRFLAARAGVLVDGVAGGGGGGCEDGLVLPTPIQRPPPPVNETTAAASTQPHTDNRNPAHVQCMRQLLAPDGVCIHNGDHASTCTDTDGSETHTAVETVLAMYSGPDNSKMYTLGGSNLCNVLQSVLVCKCTGSVRAFYSDGSEERFWCTTRSTGCTGATSTLVPDGTRSEPFLCIWRVHFSAPPSALPPPLHPKVPATPPAAGAKAAAGGASSTAAGVAASPSRRSSTACNAMAVLEWAARFLHADLGRHYDVQKALLTADAEAFGVKGRENIAKINGELLADSEKTVRVALSFCFLGCFLVSYFLAYLEGTAEVFPVPRLYALPSLFLSLSRWHSCILILFTLMCAVPVVLYNDTHTIKGLRLTLPYCNRCGECDGDTNV